ncbi:MAG: hypothetical protein JWM04_1595 [Verrucomicrobiales bacterium]|nr:hypothetical protein [Verrucomicrobiales bacterium]
MKLSLLLLLGIIITSGCAQTSRNSRSISLFDGKTFNGWEGETQTIWKIREGAIVGGSLAAKTPHNEFIKTTRPYTNFVLELKFKLVGTEGFVNGGVQFRSIKSTKPAYEMIGYQADMGEGWWGCLYDESRRDKVLQRPDPVAVDKVLHRQEWNDYRVRCEGNRIQIWLNGLMTVDYLEPDPTIAGSGLLGLQVHGGGQTEAWYKDIRITPLP